MGLNSNYDLGDVKTDIASKTMKYHPDKNGGESQETFNLITEAYQKCIEKLKLKMHRESNTSTLKQIHKNIAKTNSKAYDE